MREIIEIAKFILGFLPWILFLFLPTNGWDPLKRAVAICLAATILFGWKDLRKGLILPWATLFFFLFCTVSFYGFGWVGLAQQMDWVSNGSLAGVIWFTVLVGKPFPLQYARADLPPERWNDESLIRSCRFIAIFWGCLLLVPVAFSVFKRLKPDALPDAFYFGLSICCIVVGIAFTTLYKRVKRQQREAAAKAAA